MLILRCENPIAAMNGNTLMYIYKHCRITMETAWCVEFIVEIHSPLDHRA